MRVRVETGGRVHIGFQNLSLAHERLYGGVGLAIDEPRAVVEAEPASTVECDDAVVATYAERACSELGVNGARVEVCERLPRHVGLGSGTQLALATLTAVARAHDVALTVRKRAPALGRGGRSGVGVATFEAGGFVVDAGHPTERFTTDPPAAGSWTVPEVVARRRVPDDWRLLLVLPDAAPGRSGDDEDESIRAVVEDADPGVADELAGVLVRRLLPAVAEGRLDAFGDAVGAFGRLNGAWYADQQGGVYRPPAGRIIDRLSDCPAVRGLGQSSWGPAVYGVTDASMAADATADARAALSELGVDARVQVVEPRNEGARVETL
ncbi:GHMP family kinase (homolog to beta-ribofuranosylaminobenzene 5'-phosphate synthase) [Natronomonas pharaonis DSM 2160]|uniref:Beta-ribofuranosylaminobenzene 5'-phosphate synthase n=1 Tax=Natronomonas pharaonis (strain ATCC 35678 / DSM 2160 / CIP 103997 / JCM 8858 / NBRC 14720 / NCIMB 2260 / Gabara) TaxID=348780 RepID=A0A1U7EZ31_NATPD|nr:beta-ribofuranosylaminobenzene 5'-phosphate synthase family protein [Natronomonas pharaonis]CAI50556.1 GHMP family kinase (homolog to beta-ribofuranosylaminobenzene 5'-phosphate synthase) [Natronomonas pharaonis DSM 2160]